MKKSLLFLLAISPAIHGASLKNLRESFQFKNNRNVIGLTTAAIAINMIPKNYIQSDFALLIPAAGFVVGKNLWNKEGNFSFKNALKSTNPLHLFNWENCRGLGYVACINTFLKCLNITPPLSISIIYSSAAWSFGKNFYQSNNVSHAAKSMVIPTIVTSVGIGVSKLTEQYLKTYSGSKISTELGMLAGIAVAAKTLDVCRQIEPHTWLNNPIIAPQQVVQ